MGGSRDVRKPWHALGAGAACLALLSAGIAYAGRPAGADRSKQPLLSVRYHFTAEFTYHDIAVHGTRLRFTYFKPPGGTPPGKGAAGNPFGLAQQRPYWTRADLTTETATLSPAETRQLRRAILQSGFMRLKDPKPPSRRSYPHRLEVRLGRADREVTHYHGPMPRAFQEVREVLVRLVNARCTYRIPG